MRLLTLSLVVLGLAAASFAFADTKPAAAPAGTAAVSGAVPIDSLALLEKEVARDSSKFDRLYRLGVMYLDRERMQEASAVFYKASKLQPKNVKTLVNMGIAVDALGHPDDAQIWYQKALTIAPGDSMAACRLGASKYAQGKYDDAMTVFRGILARSPRASCAYFQIGVMFADAGIYRDAIRMWRKVVELAPDSPEAISAKESTDVLEKFLEGK